MNHGLTIAATCMLASVTVLGACARTASSGPRTRPGDATAPTDEAPRSHEAAAELVARRAARKPIFVNHHGACQRFDFERDFLVQTVAGEEGGAPLRRTLSFAQRGSLVDVADGCSASLDASAELAPAGCGGGVNLTLRLVEARSSYLRLRVVDATDFDPVRSPRDDCRWYLTLAACQSEGAGDDCGM